MNDIKKVQQKADVPEKKEQLKKAAEMLEVVASQWTKTAENVAKAQEEKKENKQKLEQDAQNKMSTETSNSISTRSNSSDDEEFETVPARPSPPLPHDCSDDCRERCQQRRTTKNKKKEKFI